MRAWRGSIVMDGRLLAGMLAITLLFTVGVASAQQPFTEWGWPTPYERVATTSVDWLKAKGWWPVAIASQPPWSCANALTTVMIKQGLLQQRGIESEAQWFLAGPPIIESVAAGRTPVGLSGNFLFTSMMDKQVPVRAIMVVTPNIDHAVIVPNDSPYHSLKDLKGTGAIIGIVTGSSAEFFLVSALKTHGLEAGKDVVLRNMPIPEQALLPKGVAAVVPWDFTATQLIRFKKTGRAIDNIFPYNFFQGNFYVRRELEEHAPDVVQALADAYVEALLWIRLHPDETVRLMKDDSAFKAYEPELLRQQNDAYCIYYKPTQAYIHADFWAQENERIAAWLWKGKRTSRKLTAKDYLAFFEPKYAENTFTRLGFRIPERPVFLPSNWTGTVGKLPYPEYLNLNTMKGPMAFPEQGDLTKPWVFAGKTYTP
jgi:ABC-type nitrate/sulfonate/bicarbonate transport system substrate-binding protein